MEKLSTIDAVVSALGGDEAFIRALGANGRLLRHWRSSKKFPPKTYRVIVEALAAVGASADLALWSFVEPPAAGNAEQIPAAQPPHTQPEAAE